VIRVFICNLFLSLPSERTMIITPSIPFKYFMKSKLYLFIVIPFLLIRIVSAQTIPNNDFETWISHGQYSDPQYWDTPNQEVCQLVFLYTTVVSKSTDHQSGNYSAKLESKQLPVVGVVVPGVITLGTLSIDIVNMTYGISGGVPISDKPTHLKGFFKFQPKGGDSCMIGIGLSKWITGGRDSIGIGVFSCHDTVISWTPFSAWIDYIDAATPDTMNIIAISSATFTPTPGTILYVDDLYLDYTTAVNDENPGKGIDIYQDKELRELLVFFNFPESRSTSLRLFDVMGRKVTEIPSRLIGKERVKLSYGELNPGLYILEIVNNNKRFCRKFIFNH
jgi:hypothetical protein